MDVVPDELLSAIELLPQEKQEYLKLALQGGVHSDLTGKQQAWVDEYLKDFNQRRANQAVGYAEKTSFGFLKQPKIAAVVEQKMRERDAVSALKSEYVKSYLYDILEFCPGDYCMPGGEGGWLVDPEGYQKMPQNLRRLIEEIAVRDLIVDGRPARYYWIKFVSKTTALATAARYTLTQKLDMAIKTMPWDQIAKDLDRKADDLIEARIKGVLSGPAGAQGPVDAGPPAVAGCDAIQGAA